MIQHIQIIALSAGASNVTAKITALASGFCEASASGSWMLVFPAGTSKARDGRGPFIAGGVAEMQRVIDRTKKRLGATELMVDYDHQGHFSAIEGVGGTARAAGWVKELQARADGIWARVEWTDAAAASIRAREYRYLSPLFTQDAKNGVDELLNIALVNMPALDLEAIAARTQPETDMKKIIALLKLADTASEDDIVTRVTALMASASSVAAIAAAAGLGADADPAAVTAGVSALAAKAQGVETVALAAGVAKDAEISVIAAAVTGLAKPGDATALAATQAELSALAVKFNALNAQTLSAKATAFVDEAIRQGRVGVKPLRDHYIALHAKSPEDAANVEKQINALPALGGETVFHEPARDGSVALSAAHREAARLLGHSEADVLKTLTDEAAKAA